jgi:hypothetical protein
MMSWSVIWEMMSWSVIYSVVGRGLDGSERTRMAVSTGLARAVVLCMTSMRKGSMRSGAGKTGT